MLRGLKKIVRPAVLRVHRVPESGHLHYLVDGARVHLRFREEAIRKVHRDAAYRLYFGRYHPAGTDCVVDFGAGLGTEIAMLAARAPGLRYVAVEIQPWVYECLCLTLAQLPSGFTPYGLAVGTVPAVRIAPTREGIDASILAGTRVVPVEAVSWAEFAERHGIGRIDLLKMNIEGAEADLLDHIDLAQVERVIVNVHDFRADRGEGEYFRTRRRVTARLSEAGFRLSDVASDWLFASRG